MVDMRVLIGQILLEVCIIVRYFSSFIFVVGISFMKKLFGILGDYEQRKGDINVLLSSLRMKSTHHFVTTRDSYVLNIQRITLLDAADSSVCEDIIEKQPVLFVHGFMQDSDSFICNGKNSLAYELLTPAIIPRSVNSMMYGLEIIEGTSILLITNTTPKMMKLTGITVLMNLLCMIFPP